MLDRLGICLKLFVSTESTFSHKVASLFDLVIFYTRKTPKNYREDQVSCKCLLNYEQASDPSKWGRGGNAGHGRSIASDGMSGDNSDYSGDRLSQNGE